MRVLGAGEHSIRLKTSSMRTDDYLKIDQYLQGELPADEIKDFEQRLKEEEDLAAEYEMRQQMNTYLRTQERLPELQKKMAELNSQHFGENPKPALRSIARRRLFMVVGLAAAIALLLLVWNPFSQGQLYDQFADHPALALVEKGETEEQLSSAAQAFENGDFAEAYRLLKSVEATELNNPQVYLALGISALETNQMTEAQQIFADLAGGDSALREYGIWYQALSFVKAEDYEAAKELLQNNQLNDPQLRQQAAALLAELE